MSERLVHTPYVHVKKGWPVVISGGIGDACWSVYLLKPNGASLQRCINFECHKYSEEAMQALKVYMTQPGKKIFREATGADSRMKPSAKNNQLVEKGKRVFRARNKKSGAFYEGTAAEPLEFILRLSTVKDFRAEDFELSELTSNGGWKKVKEGDK